MTSVLLERGPTAAGGTTFGFQTGTTPAGAPAGTNWSILPRCELTFEKCKGGFKIQCSCPDDVSCATLQNLCKMLCEGTCSCCCTLNGIQVCQCSLTCGICKCDFTADGCCITCTSGDKACCDMLQACCDCLSCCCDNGCCCYVCFGNTPVCCGKCG